MSAPTLPAPPSRQRRSLVAAAIVAAALGFAAAVMPAAADARNVRGGTAAETIGGSHGRDSLLGGGGNDHLWGFRGNDYLDGQAGRDRYSAGPGNDVIFARDGLSETIICGPGRDRVTADAGDVTLGCESVSRPVVSPRATPVRPAVTVSATAPTPATTTSSPPTTPAEGVQAAIITTPQWRLHQEDGDACYEAASMDRDLNGYPEEIYFDINNNCRWDARQYNSHGHDSFHERLTFDSDENGLWETLAIDTNQVVGFDYFYRDLDQDGRWDYSGPLTATAPPGLGTRPSDYPASVPASNRELVEFISRTIPVFLP